MSFIDKNAVREARRSVQTRGLKYLLGGAMLALLPFVAFALELGASGVAGGVAQVLLVAVGLPLAPIALTAGVIDTFWPRVDTCPSSGLEL